MKVLIHTSAPCFFLVFTIRFGCHTLNDKILNREGEMRYLVEISRSLGFLQGLKLINPLLGVALTDLSQGLVLVAADSDVLCVEQIVLGLLVLISGSFKL